MQSSCVKHVLGNILVIGIYQNTHTCTKEISISEIFGLVLANIYTQYVLKIMDIFISVTTLFITVTDITVFIP